MYLEHYLSSPPPLPPPYDRVLLISNVFQILNLIIFLRKHSPADSQKKLLFLLPTGFEKNLSCGDNTIITIYRKALNNKSFASYKKVARVLYLIQSLDCLLCPVKNSL